MAPAVLQYGAQVPGSSTDLYENIIVEKKKKKDIPKDPKIFNSLFALALQFILIVNDLALGAKNLLTHPCLSTRQCAEIANFKIFYWHYKI